MKKTIAIACALLAASAMADTTWTAVKFADTTANKVTTVTGDDPSSTLNFGNSLLTWDTTILGDTLTNYAISFSVNTSATGKVVFSTDSNGATSSKGLTIKINDSNKIGIYGGASGSTTLTGAPYIDFTSGTVYTLAVLDKKAYLIEGDTLPATWTGDYVTIQDSWAEDATLSTDGTRGWANGSSVAAATTPITIYGITKLSAVPEPATATLSLLALAGLAARRRRK